MDSLVRLIGVSKSFNGATALHPTDLDFAPGLTTALIGPSGCGKSTLLRLIIGLLAPDSGRVIFDGSEVSAVSAQQVRRRVGYVIQEGGLFPHLTARGNALLMSRELVVRPARWKRGWTSSCAFPVSGRSTRSLSGRLSGGQHNASAGARSCSPRSCCSTNRSARSIHS